MNPSPIVYRKLNKKPNQEQKTNSKSEKESEEMNLIYDDISHKFIELNNDNIKIYNKQLTIIERNVSLKLTKNRINKITTSKRLNYLLILIDGKSLLIVNLRISKVIEIIKFDTNYLKSMFFINNTNDSTSESETIFCLVFISKVIYYKITVIESGDEIVSNICLMNLNYVVSDISYSYYSNILMLSKENQRGCFDFYNLNNEKNINKTFSYFYYQSKKQIPAKSSESQFYLQNLYFKPILICLSFEDNQIQVNDLRNLLNIVRIWNFNIIISTICTLQFVDNLIIYHDFVEKTSIAFDFKSENEYQIIQKQRISSQENIEKYRESLNEMIDFSMSVFLEDVDVNIKYSEVDECNICNSNEKVNFYDMMMNIKGNIIVDLENSDFYYVYFDNDIYNIPFFQNEKIIYNLIRRKNSKITVLNDLYSYILNKKPIKIIMNLLSRLVKDYKSSLFLNENSLVSSLNKSVQQQTNSSIISEEQNINFIIYSKMNTIKLSDICYHVFSYLLYNPKINHEYLLDIIIMFNGIISKEKISQYSGISSIIIFLLRKISKDKLTMLMQFQSLPDSVELALYIINEAIDKERIFNLGIDMLKRLKKDDIIILELFRKGFIEEGLIYLKKKKITLNQIPDDIVDILKENVRKKKKLMIDFINS